MRNMPEMRTRRVSAVLGLLLFLMGAWLAWSVVQVNIDFDDGYATLTNARFHLGQSEHYYSNRGPLMAILMMPAEVLKTALGLQPMDVRVAHALMALLHLAYLIGTWLLLVRVYSSDLSTLVAYTAAMVTPVFFSYAPFLSHDIFPGFLALWMVYLADAQLRSPLHGRWWAMVAMGAILALIKQTFALVWVGIAIVVPLLLLVQKADKSKWRSALGLLSAAALSGVITWLGYGLALAPGLGSEPLWLRPWLQMTLISTNYAAEGGAWQAFYPWVYAQNLWAYGILAMMLLLPGLVLALWRGSSFERLVALFWLFFVVALHLTPYKEVRYLAVLAPFNALLLVAVLRRIWQSRVIYRLAVVVLLVVGIALAVSEAQRIRDPYYAQAISDFLQPLPKADAFAGRVIIASPLSFVSPEDQAYFGDRYHRITHLTLAPIASAYGYRASHSMQLEKLLDLSADLVSPGDIGLFASGALGRARPFVRGNRQGLASDFIQILGLAQIIVLEREPEGYRIAAQDFRVSYLVIPTSKETRPTIAEGHLSESEAVRLFAWGELPQRADVVAFRILRYCNWNGCFRVEQAPEPKDSTTLPQN